MCASADRRCCAKAFIGALLTGLTILLFLRDWRTSLIVVITIPFALLTAVVALWATGADDQHYDARWTCAGGGRAGG